MIDANVKIGHYPFRKLENNTAAGMIALMDEYGVEKAVVSSINAIFYADTQCGNEELAEEIKPYSDRFLPLAIINPEYTGWEKDLETCVTKLGMKGIELFPGYHNYTAKSAGLAKLLAVAASYRLPVFIPSRLIDIRGHHWMDTPENISVQDYVDIVKLNKDVDFVITGTSTGDVAKALKSQVRSGRILYDFSRLEVFHFNPTFYELVKEAGIENIVYATCAPFQYPDVQLVKLNFSGLSEDDIKKITSENLLKLWR